jgi:predicted transcriptional regulator
VNVPFTIRLDDATYQRVRDLADRERQSISFMAAELIRQALEQRSLRDESAGD